MSASTEQSHFPKGSRLGPYEIASTIGAGGMGEVFRARDTRLNRDVAVKVLPMALRFTTTPSLLLSLWCWLLTSVTAAIGADFLPPAPPWKEASEALVAKADDPWITPSEKTGLTDTPNYDETIAYLKSRTDPTSAAPSIRAGAPRRRT